MEFPQSSLEEISESERQMVITAEQRFGKHYINARAASVLLSRCVVSVDHDRMNFGRYFAFLKKQHMLAILSAIRLHKVQAMMDLRQALEAGAAAAFAIANPADDHFFKVDQNNIITTGQKLATKRYKWLEAHFRAGSDAIKSQKDLINEQQAHANIVSTDSVFAIGASGEMISAPFFDKEDGHFIKTDLWLASSAALILMNLFYEVNNGRNVIEFMPNFLSFLSRLRRDTDALRDEMMATDRYKAAMEKANATRAPVD